MKTFDHGRALAAVTMYRSILDMAEKEGDKCEAEYLMWHQRANEYRDILTRDSGIQTSIDHCEKRAAEALDRMSRHWDLMQPVLKAASDMAVIEIREALPEVPNDPS